MAKKKRTRKDKMQTDLRREASTTSSTKRRTVAKSSRQTAKPKAAEQAGNTFSLPQEYVANIGREAALEAVGTPQNVSINTSAYRYLRGDLLKTMTLTTLIIASELFIYFFWMK